DPAKPTVGLWFFQHYWINQNLEHIDALIRAIEARGANVLPVFSMRLYDASLGNRGADEIVRGYFMADGAPRIDVLINVMSMSMTLTNAAYQALYPELGVAVLQAMTCSQPYAVWRDSPQGMGVMDVTHQAAQPEFDGNLITVPVATREEDTIDPLTGALLARLAPIPDRIDTLVSLALNWAKLRRLTNAEKRIAIIFHHYPPRNDRIGCAAGLDSFASVKYLLDAMAAAGYQIDQQYADGDELANALLQRMTCDQRWLTPDQLAARATASAGREVFLPWHEALPPAIREQMTADWGPMPGELFVHEDTLYFAGLLNGNIFLTIQPPRGYLEKVEAILHDLHLSPPHHYLAHYRWIRDVFKADAVMHVGKHGSLEWLPGKALGLSEECYPDLAIQDLPNVYPYIINDPSEGTQAKRRAYCCIIDHLTPACVNADLYEDLSGVERALADYAEAQRQDPGKLPVLAGMLWEAVVKADLHQELEVTEDEAKADMAAVIGRIHAYLSELADTMIHDGLHIMGHAPAGERLVEFLAQLTRLPNGDVPSLREELVAMMGHDYDDLLAHRGEIMPYYDGQTGGQLIARAHDRAVALISALAARAYDSGAVEEVVRAHCGGPAPRIARALRYLAETLVPNIRRVTDEIAASLAAFDGRFVPPGPSGAPSRGQADILPTGRNFFSLDPRIIPSPAAWEVGVALGDALLARFLDEQGHYPDSVGIIVWGGPTMRSKGDDIAEILYLLGVRPVWQANGIVSGLAIIPAEELGRPRIDVTPRISGFFRDAFPNLVQLIDEAARMVAALREDPETNFIRRHVLADQAEYRAEGLSEEEAWRLATLRVFGCPPGTYGAGVAELVEAKAWRTQADLGEAYIRYSAHAYGEGSYGEQRPRAFRRLLSRMEVTVKNEDSREYDLLSCTDFYNYYGGLIAAAAAVRGAMPVALVGDSADPRRVAVRSAREEAKHVLRARLLNPKWLEGMKRHGYKGAGDIAKVMDIIIGWDATAEVMDDWMYERVAAKYALDPAMQQWLKAVNPYALHNILDKLLETIQRGMWGASDEMQRQLRDAYLDIEGEIEEVVEGAPV
ncbi:MAG TPA: cobaltochelatase subunit CobN, partial [Armatimonadota bacterium]|nr:cobaltochelatase subunit CobN [Armatimonadota bacterium]